MKKIVRYTLMTIAIIFAGGIVIPVITVGWLILGFPCVLNEWAFDDKLEFWETMKWSYGGCLREFGFQFSWNKVTPEKE